MKTVLIKLIMLYQHTLSPDHGWFRAKWPYGFCRYHPTCSQYSKEAIETHGALKGTALTIKRIIRCNPFAAPGVDQVPKL